MLANALVLHPARVEHLHFDDVLFAWWLFVFTCAVIIAIRWLAQFKHGESTSIYEDDDCY